MASDSQLTRVSLPQRLMGAAVYGSLILQLQERQHQVNQSMASGCYLRRMLILQQPLKQFKHQLSTPTLHPIKV